MPALPNTPRPSKAENLEALYNQVNAAQPTGIRAQIVNRQGQMAWGLSKSGGGQSLADFMSNQYQTNFGRGGGGPFTPAGLNYAAQTLGHDNSNYH